MEMKRVPPIRKSPYLVGSATIALVLLLAVMAPQFWNANPSNAAVDDSAPILPSTNEPNSEQPSSSDDPLAAESPSITHGEAVLKVAIAPHLFDDSQGEAGAPAPYSDESRADEFAIGVVGKVVERGNSKYLPLKLNEVFIGRLPSGPFLAKDKMVIRMECEWTEDTVRLELPLTLYSSHVSDAPDMFAFRYGPDVLADLIDYTCIFDNDAPFQVVTHDNEREWNRWKASFRTQQQPRNLWLIPLRHIVDETYSVYFERKAAEGQKTN